MSLNYLFDKSMLWKNLPWDLGLEVGLERLQRRPSVPGRGCCVQTTSGSSGLSSLVCWIWRRGKRTVLARPGRADRRREAWLFFSFSRFWIGRKGMKIFLPGAESKKIQRVQWSLEKWLEIFTSADRIYKEISACSHIRFSKAKLYYLKFRIAVTSSGQWTRDETGSGLDLQLGLHFGNERDRDEGTTGKERRATGK